MRLRRPLRCWNRGGCAKIWRVLWRASQDGPKPREFRWRRRESKPRQRGRHLVADNTDACPAYKALVRAKNSAYLSIPFGEDVELTMKL